jgi:hypothetical protein
VTEAQAFAVSIVCVVGLGILIVVFNAVFRAIALLSSNQRAFQLETRNTLTNIQHRLIDLQHAPKESRPSIWEAPRDPCRYVGGVMVNSVCRSDAHRTFGVTDTTNGD